MYFSSKLMPTSVYSRVRWNSRELHS